MAYFPVFMDLAGQPVLVVGGGKVAARKVRALLKSGAAVAVIATTLGEELETRRARGEIAWAGREFSAGMIEGYWLAFAATNDRAVNRLVFEAGESRGIAVNVVDDRAQCRFISPAVIDRDPVQVAVSTGGTSPTLARAVRNWIEALLPHGLGKVAAAAGRLRSTIAGGLSGTSKRRAWEFLLDPGRVVHWSAQSPRAIEAEMRVELKHRARRPAVGKVYLVGAGPGRPDLLTLRAVEVLQHADVVLHDRLVPPEILDRARRDAERIDVGKRAGDHHHSDHGDVQERIFDLLVETARAGKTVVRLKGGDAFVFGRGGEELQHLRAHGIDYEVVPGITAALGCAAYAGIPLTHRDHAQQLTIATGHRAGHAHGSVTGVAQPGHPVDVHAAGGGETLVVYMGVKQARRVRAGLLDKGLPASTPAALIIDGTMERQRVLHGTLAGLPAMAAQVENGAPGLFIIGAVAALGRDLAWFGGVRALEAAA